LPAAIGAATIRRRTVAFKLPVAEVSTDRHRHDGTAWELLDVPVNSAAQYVRVALTNRDSLQLYEVEVWGRTGAH
jgi:hypothetical protein